MDYVRKLAEYLFNDTNIEINIVIPKNINGGDSTKLEPKKEATQEIIVRSEGKTYCELLKSIKQNVDIEKAGIKVRSMRQTSNRAILFRVEGQGNQANIFMEEIKSTLKEADVRVMRHESVLHITDIPATVNESSVLKDIMDDMGILDSQALRVKPLRSLQDGKQAATVIIRRDLANKRIRRGTCYRCLAYGHNRNDCSGPDRSEECLNYGATGQTVHQIRSEELTVNTGVPQGDFNAKSREWGSPIEDRRGMYLVEYMAALDIVAHNTDGTPTFQRGNSESFIHITLSTQSVAKKITNWKVMENKTLSDHKHIYFEIMGAGAKQNIERQSIYKKSCMKGERTEEWLPFWWNKEIEHKKRECVSLRREKTRKNRANCSPTVIAELQEQYKKAKKELRLIIISKKQLWKNVCTEIDEDVWGNGYKIPTRHLKNQSLPYNITRDTKLEIAARLFPSYQDVLLPTEPVLNEKSISVDELPLTQGSQLIAYADDLALLTTAKDEEQLMYRTNESLRRICVWMVHHNLQLAPEKTEAIVHLYLGVLFGDRGTFGNHVKCAADKAAKRIAALTRLMPNLGGVLSSKREVLNGVVESILLYGAAVWYKALRRHYKK
nr:unnamed protein product [Callosobruchus analis]